MRYFKYTILLVVVLLLVTLTGMSGVASADECYYSGNNSSEIKQTSATDSNVEYDISINKTSNCARVNVSKYDSTTWPIRIRLHVDDQRIKRTNPELEPGESWNTTWDFSQMYDVTNDTHSVRVSTTGPDLEANIEKDFDLSDPDIPAQRITDVDLVETTNEDGDRIAEAAVTFENPSPHANPGEVFVHTSETDGSGDLALVPMSEETATTHIELDDDPDDTIEGEIRYSSEHINEDEGVREQVWFRGEVDGDVTFQREEFEPVAYPTEDDAYTYDDEDSVLQHVPPTRHLAAGLLVAGVLVTVVSRRYWNG